MSASSLANTPLWLNGPEFINLKDEVLEESTIDVSSVPDDCQKEMKRKECVLIAIGDETNISTVIDSKRFSSAYRLFHLY